MEQRGDSLDLLVVLEGQDKMAPILAAVWEAVLIEDRWGDLYLQPSSAVV